MRWICWAAVLFSAVALASPAAWAQGCGCGNHYSAYGAPACAAPAYGCATQPGCCEHPPSCCDDAWAGYCEEKARWEAYWRAACQSHAYSYRQPTCATYGQPASCGSSCGERSWEPTVPATPAEPAPAVAPSVPAAAPSPATTLAPRALEPVPEPAIPKSTGIFRLPRLW